MGIIATDVLVKTMLEAALHDLRRSPWLLDDVFGELAGDPLSRLEYGYKEVDQAKKWFLANEIKVYMPFRIDAPNLPCLSIVQTSSSEISDRALLGDVGEVGEIEPVKINRPIQKVYDNFAPVSYSPDTGYLVMPKSSHSDIGDDSPVPTAYAAPGQFVVSQRTGKAYEIKEVVDDITIRVAANLAADFTEVYVAPQSSLWNVHREFCHFQEAYEIGCHAQSDPVQTMWLRQLVLYIFLRYKEVYLEARGFEQSSIQAGAVQQNPQFDMERVFTCAVNVSGIAKGSWIKFVAPKLLKSEGGIKIIDGPKSPDGMEAEVKKRGWGMEPDDV